MTLGLLRQNHPAWRLLRSEHATWVAGLIEGKGFGCAEDTAGQRFHASGG